MRSPLFALTATFLPYTLGPRLTYRSGSVMRAQKFWLAEIQAMARSVLPIIEVKRSCGDRRATILPPDCSMIQTSLVPPVSTPITLNSSTTPAMNAASVSPADSSVDSSAFDAIAIATALDRLSAHKAAWLQVAIPQRIQYLQRCLEGVIAVAEDWATAACLAKGIDPATPLAGEEWTAGPVAALMNIRSLIKALEANGHPSPVKISRRVHGKTAEGSHDQTSDQTGDRAGEQVVAQVFPDHLMEQLLWLGFKGEVWLEPDRPPTQGQIYRQKAAEKTAEGTLALVLGAGNISAIAPLDMFYKLFAEDQVVLIKMNPVNAYVGPFLEQAFKPLIEDGFCQIVYGGAELGRYLCQHPAVDTLHITGSHHTHNAILWGDATPQPLSTRESSPSASVPPQPNLNKPITSELGCVTPILVVPGNWSQGDIAFQARQVASMVAHNASFNCVAAKVIVTVQGWAQREEFLQQVHQQLAKTPTRKAYYPGARQRYGEFLQRYPQAQVVGAADHWDAETDVPWTVIPNVAADAAEYALTTEAFCGVVAEVSLPATTAAEFLAAAVPFANDKVWGNLSCVLLIDPATRRQNAAAVDGAIAQLRYGAIGINVWTGVGFLLPALTWGAFPGNPLADIQSGRGVVHNAYLFDHPQKSVLSAPFRVFPTPLWFADHKNLLQVAQRFAALQRQPSWWRFFRVVLAALKG